MGTPGYMAPEQIRDASSVDRRADLWSLGCILYRLTCGVPPFEGDDIIELFNSVANGDFLSSRDIRRDLPEKVHDCIEALLTVDRTHRVADCTDVIAYLDGDITELRRPLFPGTLPKALSPHTDRPRWLPGTSEAAEVARSQFDETLGHLPKLKPFRDPQHDWVETPGPRQRIEDLPALLADTSDPHEQVTIAPAPVRRTVRKGWMVGLAGVGAIGAAAVVIVGAVGLAFFIVSLGGGSTTETDEVALTDVTAPPPEPAPVMIQPDPPPNVVEPALERPTPTPPPIPVPPRPVPVRPAAGATASVSFTGAKQLWLESEESGEAFRSLGAVPAGTYKIKAIFEGEPNVAVAGRITLRDGQQLTLRCVPDFQQCK
jgi:hypothetical protein